jgi:hypothetical protein
LSGIEHPAQPDFGPPLGCGNAPQPHNKIVQVTALSTANTGTLVTGYNAVVVFDTDGVEIVQHVGQLPQRQRTFPIPGALMITLS